tara:strand:+ start:279 stop:2192 length:1914 start_codon:yes stop_codon:yes gene_type:complete
MKLEIEPQDVAVHGNFKTSEFKTGDTAFIVDMFADKVYSHKERAVIREMACNAHDSHIMAGTEDVPFDVHIPTRLEPYFSLRDYGTGLTDEEVRDHYAGIGISTKRDNQDVIGCYGIGTLSPYSLADSFTVKSYKNGVCRTYSCYRNDQRVPVVSLLTECETDEPNGIEVNVSVEGRVYEFGAEAVYVFKFWEGTLPNINDKYVVEQCEDARKGYAFEGDGYGLKNTWGDVFAVMGNIAYTIPRDLDEFRCEGYLKFELGELSFDTGRENLAMDTKTKEALKAKFAAVKEALTADAIAQIEALPTAWDQAVLADKLNKGELGKKIKADLQEYAIDKTTEEMTYFSGYSRNYGGIEKGITQKIPMGGNVVYYASKPRFQSRIKQHLKDQFHHTTLVLLTTQQIMETGVPADLINDLEDLPKVYSSRSSGSGTVDKCKVYTIRDGYDSYQNRKNWTEAEVDLKDGEERVYVEINRFEVVGQKWFTNNTSQIRSSIDDLKAHIGDVKVYGIKSVLLKSKGFKNGNWISLDEYLKRETTKVAPKKIQKFTEDSSMAKLFCSLADMVDDERFAEFKTLYDSQDEYSFCKTLSNLEIEVEESYEADDVYKDIIDSHDIFGIIDTRHASNNLSKIAKYIINENN